MEGSFKQQTDNLCNKRSMITGPLSDRYGFEFCFYILRSMKLQLVSFFLSDLQFLNLKIGNTKTELVIVRIKEDGVCGRF